MAAGTVLLERDVETARITSALRRSAEGAGTVVVIEGVPGIGKTQLLTVAGLAAQADGALVLRARAGELERSFAFGVVRQLFAPVLARAADGERARHLEGAADLAAPLFDPARLADTPGGAIYPLLHGLFWLAVNLARDGALVLCVDDAQWADEPSLQFLEFLSRRVADERIAVIVASRPSPADAPSALAALVADAANEKLRPVALTTEATAALLASRLGTPGVPAFAEACHAATGGNPFLLGELLRLLEGEGIVPAAATVDEVRALGTKAVGDNVLMRVARAGPGARALVDAVAVLGDGATAAQAATAAGVDPAAVAALVTTLRDVGVLADGTRLAFAHPVLRTAIYESIPTTDREAMHVEVARALVADDGPPEQIAAHVLAVPRALGDWVLPPLRAAAATALAVGDLGTARQLLERALVETDDTAVLAALGRVQVLSMDVAAAGTLARVLARREDPATAARAANDLAVQMLFLGRIDELVSVLTETEAAITPLDAELGALLGAGLLAATTISFAAAARLAARVNAAEDHGRAAATVPERVALVALGNRDVLADRPVEAVRDRLRRALADPTLVSDPRDVLVGRMSATGPMVMAELYAEAHALATLELEEARRSGSAFAAAAALTIRAWCDVRRGNLVTAETDAREAVALLDAVGFAGFSLALAQACLLSCARERGTGLDELEAVLDGPPPPADLAPVGVLILARAEALADRGDADAALESLFEVGHGVYADVSPCFLAWRSAAAAILAGAGRREEAEALADEELRRARASGAPGALGAAIAARGRLADDAAALPLLAEAVAVLATSDARLEHARALVDLGARIRRGGRRAEARSHLRAGHDLAITCGATVLAARAREELAASGERLAQPGLTGAQSLTPSERRVAEMAAAGLRNRDIAQALFVTEKTVETHLGRGYAKLGINSRSALARALGD